MNEQEREEYYTSLDMLDKHIDYTSKQEEKYENSSITLKPGVGPIYFELQFNVGNSTKIRQIYTYSSEVQNSYAKSFIDTAILATCREDHKSYNLIRQCFLKEVLEVEFPSKQELIARLQGLANDQECQKYWRLPDGLVVDNSKCSRYEKSKELESKTTLRAPSFNQNIFNKSVSSADSLSIRTNNSSLSALQPNYTAINQRKQEFDITNDTSLNKNGNFSAFLPLLSIIGLFTVISYIIYKLKHKATSKNKACARKDRQQVTLQKVNLENGLELQPIID